jgi:hypothetical protein
MVFLHEAHRVGALEPVAEPLLARGRGGRGGWRAADAMVAGRLAGAGSGFEREAGAHDRHRHVVAEFDVAPPR